jgi:metal-responsive CopG/Arc/MetJ family transcriptional regulator
MNDRKDVTVPMESDFVDRIDAQLEYGDSRSEWIRETARQRLARESRDNEEAAEQIRAEIEERFGSVEIFEQVLDKTDSADPDDATFAV